MLLLLFLVGLLAGLRNLLDELRVRFLVFLFEFLFIKRHFLFSFGGSTSSYPLRYHKDLAELHT